MKSPRENSTFGFCRYAEKPTPKNQKSYFLPTLVQDDKLSEEV